MTTIHPYALPSVDAPLSRPAELVSALPSSSLVAMRRQYIVFSARMATEGRAWNLHHTPGTDQFTLLRDDATMDVHLPVAVPNAHQLTLTQIEQRLQSYWIGVRAREGEPTIFVAVTQSGNAPACTVRHTIVHGSRWQDVTTPGSQSLRCIYDRDERVVARVPREDLRHWHAVPRLILSDRDMQDSRAEREHMLREANDRASRSIQQATTQSQIAAVQQHLANDTQRINTLSPAQCLLHSALREIRTLLRERQAHQAQTATHDGIDLLFAGDPHQADHAYHAQRDR